MKIKSILLFSFLAFNFSTATCNATLDSKSLKIDLRIITLVLGSLYALPTLFSQTDFCQSPLVKWTYTALGASAILGKGDKQQTVPYLIPPLVALHAGHKEVYKDLKVWHLATAASMAQIGKILYDLG
jgi:hypothetical protein